MFRKILSGLGIGSAPRPGRQHAPYRDEAANFMYNLLFCDDLEMFRQGGEGAGVPWTTLLAANPAPIALRTIANTHGEESRTRMLAFNRLRQMGQSVPEKVLLGVVVEVPLDGGLDTLAVFTDSRIRYINQTGKIAVYEGVPVEMEPLVKTLLERSQGVVNRIGPWGKPRLGPPRQGNVRMSFLVSDGLYFGEGPMNLMQREAMGGPIIAAAQDLLLAIVQHATNQKPDA